jgi:hypothetical protein
MHSAEHIDVRPVVVGTSVELQAVTTTLVECGKSVYGKRSTGLTKLGLQCFVSEKEFSAFMG